MTYVIQEIMMEPLKKHLHERESFEELMHAHE